MSKTGTKKKLLIVESPAKIKTISKFLGKEFTILSTYGHVKDLPPKKIGVSIDDKKSIVLEYVAIEKKGDTIAQICKAARNCDEIFLASDPDREGEIISWHIGQEIEKVINPSKTDIHRIVFNEITKPAVQSAIENKKSIDIDKVNAQQARRVLDRWVGYEVSPVLWRKIKKGLSAGRVQSVALMLICDREEAIEKFIPEESWSIHANFLYKTSELEAQLDKIKKKKPSIKNKEAADKILAQIKDLSFRVIKVEDKKRAKKPLPPFMTSTLQQDAYNKLGFSVDRTMRIAQQLYEGVPLGDPKNPEALITYMRTDSLRLSETALTAARSYISENFGADYLPKSAQQYAKKGAAQDAHEAIRPIDANKAPQKVASYLKPEQAKLYELIWRRFIASQMTPAEYFQRVVHIESGDFLFKARGSSLVFDGFLKVYDVEEDDKDTVKIPADIAAEVETPLKESNGKQHFTKPPARYSEATLVKELEKQDIGRPSTYATILSTLQKRQYVTVDNKRFFPSELGRSVSALLTKNLPDIINVNFTADMEKSLDKIAEGNLDRDELLVRFHEKLEKDVSAFAEKKDKKEAQATNLKCPKCEQPLLIRFGKAGEFAGCSGYPECTFTSNFKRNEDGQIELVEADEQEGPEKTGIECPKCGKEMIKRIGRFGPFIACSGYPECKHIHQETLKMPCPQCGSKIGQRSWRGGKFWGCTQYPKCKFAIFGNVEETPCVKCKNTKYVVVTKTKDGKTIRTCPDKACGHKEITEEE